jgi:hypothetical protein
MNLRLFSMALALGIALLGFSVTAHADAAADFALFDNTNPATLHEGIVCTSDKAFTYHISVSNFGSSPNVLRLTYADGDFTRFKIPQDGSLNLSGGARGGKEKGKSGGNPDRCITICGESAQLAGQMSIIQENGKPSCQNVTCGAGGVAPPC